MPKILILHEDAGVRERLSAILRAKGFETVEFASVADAKREDYRSFALHICGQLGKYSDGLLYALGVYNRGAKILIVSDRQKFTRIPFLHIATLANPERSFAMIHSALRGGP